MPENKVDPNTQLIVLPQLNNFIKVIYKTQWLSIIPKYLANAYIQQRAHVCEETIWGKERVRGNSAQISRRAGKSTGYDTEQGTKKGPVSGVGDNQPYTKYSSHST